MFSFLKIRAPASLVPDSNIKDTYRKYKVRGLFGVFLGYMGYYLVRANFTISTPYLKHDLGLSSTEIGFIASCLLISYGIAKGIMSSLADSCDTKRFIAFGLILSAVVNIFLGFSTSFWIFVALVVVNGVAQGMGVGPSFITISKYYTTSERGRVTALWNISHNLGGGLVAPLVGGSIAFLGSEHWQMASFAIPALCAFLIALTVLVFGVSSPYTMGLPPLEAIQDGISDNVSHQYALEDKAPEGYSSWRIFRTYVLPNKGAWLVAFVDVFVYLLRFGVITWLPIYLLSEKGFTKLQMGTAFAFFEWSAIPSTLIVGYLTDKVFKGKRMLIAAIAMFLIIIALYFYSTSDNISIVIFAASVIGCLIFVPQFLASVVTMEVVPTFAVGSCVGLRGFMSYVLGSSAGTTLFGYLVDRFGWDAGFLLLFGAAIAGVISCVLCHFLLLNKKYHFNQLPVPA